MRLKPNPADKEYSQEFAPPKSSVEALRFRVLASLLIVALIPLIALALYMRAEFISLIQERSRVLLLTLERSHREAIDRFFNNKVSLLRSLPESGLFGMPPSSKEMRDMLTVLQGMNETILDLGVFDKDGNHISYAGPYRFLEGKNYKNEAWFKVLSNSISSFFISDVYLGYRGKPHTIVAIRTGDSTNPLYWRITIDPAGFARLVADVKLVEGATSYLVNTDGIYQIVAEWVGNPLAKAEFVPDLSQEEGVVETSTTQGKYLFAYSRLKMTDWTLIVRQDLSVAYRPVVNIVRAVILIFVLGVVFIVGASIYATGSLVSKYRRSEKNRQKLIAELFQAGKMGALGEMAAGVAHEINNPLAVIHSEAGLMEDYLDPSLAGQFGQEQFLKKVRSIKEEVFRCREVTRKLLGFARNKELKPEVCDLSALAAETIDLIQKELSFENIEIVFEPDKGANKATTCVTHSGSIKQVALNLLRNAADAIEKDGRITVRTFDNGDSVSLIVTDTGKGIAEKNLPRLFEPFFTTKEVGKGTGLGLFISHGIVTSLGGKINVSSRLGQGSEFEVVLPKQSS